MNREKLLENIIKKYSDFNISEVVINEIIDSVNFKENDISLLKIVELKVEEYIAYEILNENIEYQIVVEDKFDYLKLFIKRISNNLTDSEINLIYQNAIENAVQNYDGNKLFSVNVLASAKKIVANKKSNTDSTIKNDISNVQIKLNLDKDKTEQLNTKSKNKTSENDIMRDLSIMKKYISVSKMSKERFANIIRCNPNAIDNVLIGKVKFSDSSLRNLYIKFDANTYDEFVKNVNDRINHRMDLCQVFRHIFCHKAIFEFIPIPPSI